jgi:hypothetical protein
LRECDVDSICEGEEKVGEHCCAGEGRGERSG